MKTYISLFLLVILFGSIYLNPFAEDNNEQEQVNIVFLFSDDQSAPDLGVYGNDAIHTPNLDRMADEAMVFRRAYVPSSQCSPARASILTGRSPHSVGGSRLHANVHSEFTSLVKLLNDEDYFTGAYRKVHQDNIQSQFDFYRDNDDLAKFFEERPDNEPFFLWFGSRDPHRPYNSEDYDYSQDPAEVVVPDYLPDTEAVRKDLANYYNEITRFDRESGDILGLLEEHGLSENTIVVMSSDNGMPFPRAKATLYEAGAKVPLIIKWPGHTDEGTFTDELVSLIDLTPTWLEAAGINVPEEMEGRSLAPLLKGNQIDSREYVFTERNWHDTWDPIRAVTGERYKLIQNYRPEIQYIPSLDIKDSPSFQEIQRLQSENNLPEPLSWYAEKSRPRVEFYDLENDPGEWNNLAGNPEYDSLITEYQKVLSEWMNETNDFLPPPQGAFPESSGLNGKYDVLNAQEF